jgi:tetratricopeptide (TPR) repeat protein
MTPSTHASQQRSENFRRRLPARARRTHRWLVALIALTGAAGALAADDEWLEVKTPRMTVLSQVGEAGTVEWIEGFDQFVDALHHFLPLNEALLPPLTIVLFERSRDYAPYRVRTESGTVATNTGVFVNFDTWSIMSLSASSRMADADHTMFHEAVHWFMSADPVARPIWFDEGIAEVFATYTVERGKVRWGKAIPEHVSFLRYSRLQPMEAFLRSSQDEALHGTETYYAQSWAFVHYLLFGEGGGSRAQLVQFLASLRETGLQNAFESSFGKGFDEVGADLENYLRRGTYGMTEIPIEDIPRAAAERSVDSASRAQVQLGLARLALGTGNIDLAKTHAQALAELAPDRAETYDTLAAVASESNDESALDAALARAIELDSRDALTYELKARRLYASNRRSETNPPDEIFYPAVARDIADAMARAIEIRPFKLQRYEMFVDALVAADEFRDNDTRVLDFGRRLYPDAAVFDLGAAAVARGSGQPERALEHLTEALAEDRTRSLDLARTLRYLRERWTVEHFTDRIRVLTEERSFESARAEIDAVLAAETEGSSLYRTLTDMRGFVVSLERLDAVELAFSEGRSGEARELLEAMVADPETNRLMRRDLEQRLERLGPR